MLELMNISSKLVLISILSCLAVTLFFFPALCQNSRSIQWDALDLHYPHLAFFSRSIQNGVVPLWEPHIYCGYSFIGYLQSGSFYPVNFFVSLFKTITPRVMIFLTVFSYFSALAGTFVLSRFLGLSIAGSSFSAITWCFSGQLLGHATHLGIIQFYALFPWVLLLAERGFHKTFFTFLSALLLGFSILAGHFQSALYGIVFWCCWLIAINPSNKHSKTLSPFSFIIIFLLAFVICIAATGIQLLTTADQALQSSRHELSKSLGESESFQLISLITLFRPNHFGGINGPYSGPWDRTNQQCHAGFITPVFWLIALIYSIRTIGSGKRIQSPSFTHSSRFHGKFLLFLWLWTIIGFFYSIGPKTFVHSYLRSILPGWELVRTPAAILPLVCLSLSLLAGAGLDWFTSRFSPKLNLMLKISIPLLTFIQLSMLYRNSDLMFGKQAPYESFAPTSHRLFLDACYAEDASGFRIHEWDIGKVLLTNESSWKGWYQTGGRVSGLHYRRVGELLRFSEYNKTILDILRARYILVSEKPSEAFVVSTATVPTGSTPWKPSDALQKVSPGILFNPESQPYLFSIDSWIVNTQEANIPELLLKTDFNRVALLEEEPGLTPSATPPRFDFTISTNEYHRLDFDYSLDKPALLVIGDAWASDWKASIDGTPLKLLRADHALRAVAAPAGEHRLTLLFHPIGYILGAFITLTALSMTIAVATFNLGSFHRQ